jgi:hypothetical protein
MPKQVQFGGQIHSFPDDFTDEDIAKALGGVSPPSTPVTPTTDKPDSFASKFFGLPALRSVTRRENLPMTGGMIGGMAGGVPGALAGGALGEGLRQATGDAEERRGVALASQAMVNPLLVWMMNPDDRAAALGSAGRMVGSGALHGGLEGVGRGLGTLATKGSKWFLDASLKPGFRVPRIDAAPGSPPITNPGSLAARFRPVDITEEAWRRNIPITNRGIQEVDLALTRSRDAALEAERAYVRRHTISDRNRMLPEGGVNVPTGSYTPVPTVRGGRLSYGPSHATERVPFSRIRSRQGTDTSPRGNVSQIYGGTPARGTIPPTAASVVVEGPGTIRLTGRPAGAGQLAPSHPAIPRSGPTIGLEEALEPAIRRQARQRGIVGADDAKALDDLIAKVRNDPDWANPVDVIRAQRRKDVAAKQAQALWLEGKGGSPLDQFQQDLTRGYKQAIEHRIPEIKGMNKETQKLLALYETMRAAFDVEARSGRWTTGGLLDNPRIWGAVRTGLKRLSPVFDMTPTALRGAYLALDNMFNSNRQSRPELQPSHSQNQIGAAPGLGAGIGLGAAGGPPAGTRTMADIVP